MELIRGIHNIRQRHQKCVLTIGNFDGVHLGHQAILHRVKTLARRYDALACIMIFEPQPREYFAPEDAPGRISRLRDKIRWFQDEGIDSVLCLPFNRRLQQLTADEFCRTVLQEGLHVQHLVVGDDFRFGCDRQGDFEYLHRFGTEQGFLVENTPSVLTESGKRISSSLVRSCLREGDVEQAESLLGHPLSLEGRVVHGKKLGRTLGFPTANIHLKIQAPAMSGVYAVRLIHCGVAYDGVANIGTRPTVSGQHPILEVHLFNFKGDLYDAYVEVQFCHFIRAERKMSGLPELEKQIQCDKEEAIRFFTNQ